MSTGDRTKFEIFISSRMMEFSAERRMLYDLIPSMSNDVVELKAWVYEINAPASSHTIRDNYLKTLINSELYIAILGQGYGEWTVDEFNVATRESIPRHVYVLVMPDEERDDKQSAFIKQIQGVEFGIAPRYFTNIDDLRRAVADSIQVWLRERLMHRPGSTSATFASRPLMVDNVPSKLIGREHLLSRVNPLLDEGELVLLRGFGGMGKTALAATIAKERIEAGKGAVLWQKLGSENLETTFQALARPFNAHQGIAAAQSDDEKRAIIRQLIVSEGVQLVVLDDAWDGKTLNAVLRAIPQGIPTLVTSRHRYGLRTIVEVGELAPDKAIETLGYYANADYSNDRAAKILCQHLGYHAFALEVAGQTIRADNILPAQLLERVKDAPQKMKVPEDFAEEGRATVADLITASLTMLDNETQRVFMAMGAFFAKQMTPEMLALYFTDIPPVSEEMVANAREQIPDLNQVSDEEIKSVLQQYVAQGLQLPVQQVETALEVLARRGLIEREKATNRSTACIRVHDLAYAYARATHPDADLLRAVDACLAYTWRYNKPSLENFAALRPELDNFLGAAAWAFSAGQLIKAERFAWNLYMGSEVLDYLGFYNQAITLLELAADSAARRNSLRDQGGHLGNLGIVFSSLGRFQDSVQAMSTVLDIARQLGDKAYEGNALGNLGLTFRHLGDIRKAIDYHEQALIISREIESRQSEGNDLASLGLAYEELGEYDKAIDYYEQALTITREIGERRSEGSILGNLGNVYAVLQQFDKAIEYHKQALAIRQAIGDRMGESNDLNNIGAVYNAQENYPLALEYYEKARDIRVEIGVQHMIEKSDERIARVKNRMAKSSATLHPSSPLPTDNLADALAQAYRQSGADGVRHLLKQMGASDDMIQTAIDRFRNWRP